MKSLRLRHLLVLFCSLATLTFFTPAILAETPNNADVVEGFFQQGGHTNNWAVLVRMSLACSSFQ